MSGQAQQLQELMAFFTIDNFASPISKAKQHPIPSVKKIAMTKQATLPNESEFVRF